MAKNPIIAAILSFIIWFRGNIRRKDHDGNCICYCSTDIVCSHIHGNILCMDNIHSPLVIRYI